MLPTHHGAEQLQVLVIHRGVQALVASAHGKAATEGGQMSWAGTASLPPSKSPHWAPASHLHICHSGALSTMWSAWRTWGSFK